MKDTPSFYIINVGHGNSSVLTDVNGVVVFDAGPRADLLHFLLDNQINNIDYLLLSHADHDHIGGAMALIDSEEINIKKVFVNSDAIQRSSIWTDLIFSLSNSSVELEPSLTPNLNGQLDQGLVQLEILAPDVFMATMAAGGVDPKGRKITSNSISAVIRLLYEDEPIILLGGDIDSIGFENMIEKNNDISANLLVFPHHGGKPGKGDPRKFTIDICEAVNPKHIVFSVGSNEMSFPREEIVSTIDEKFSKIQMITTGYSETLANFNKKNKASVHKNKSGNIEVLPKSGSLVLKFEHSE